MEFHPSNPRHNILMKYLVAIASGLSIAYPMHQEAKYKEDAPKLYSLISKIQHPEKIEWFIGLNVNEKFQPIAKVYEQNLNELSALIYLTLQTDDKALPIQSQNGEWILITSNSPHKYFLFSIKTQNFIYLEPSETYYLLNNYIWVIDDIPVSGKTFVNLFKEKHPNILREQTSNNSAITPIFYNAQKIKHLPFQKLRSFDFEKKPAIQLYFTNSRIPLDNGGMSYEYWLIYLLHQKKFIHHYWFPGENICQVPVFKYIPSKL